MEVQWVLRELKVIKEDGPAWRYAAIAIRFRVSGNASYINYGYIN